MNNVQRFLLDERGDAEGNVVGAVGLIIVLLLFLTLATTPFHFFGTNMVNSYGGTTTVSGYHTRALPGTAQCKAWYIPKGGENAGVPC